MALAGILGVQGRGDRGLVQLVVVGPGGKGGRDGLGVGHFDVASVAVEGRVEFADRRQRVAGGRGVAAAAGVAVLSLELGDAVFEVANVFNGGLEENVLVLFERGVSSRLQV